MSPLWPEHLTLYMGDAVLVLARVQRRWARRTIAIERHLSETPDAQQASLPAILPAMAARLGARRHVTVNCIVGGRHARQLVSPWAEGLVTNADFDAAARALFRQTLGGGLENWLTYGRPQRFGQPWLAMAFERGPLAGLGQVCQSMRTSIGSIASCISLSCDSTELPQTMVVAELNATAVFFGRDGGWRSARQLWHEETDPRQLAQLAEPGEPISEASGHQLRILRPHADSLQVWGDLLEKV